LIETVVMISMTGLLLSLASVMIQQAYAAHSRSLEHFRNMEQLQRLGARLRGDVQAAESIDVAPAGGVAATWLHLQSAGQTLEYRFQNGVLGRFRIEDGQDIGADYWTLGERAQWSSHWDRSAARPLLLCRLSWDVYAPVADMTADSSSLENPRPQPSPVAAVSNRNWPRRMVDVEWVICASQLQSHAAQPDESDLPNAP